MDPKQLGRDIQTGRRSASGRKVPTPGSGPLERAQKAYAKWRQVGHVHLPTTQAGVGKLKTTLGDPDPEPVAETEEGWAPPPPNDGWAKDHDT